MLCSLLKNVPNVNVAAIHSYLSSFEWSRLQRTCHFMQSIGRMGVAQPPTLYLTTRFATPPPPLHVTTHDRPGSQAVASCFVDGETIPPSALERSPISVILFFSHKHTRFLSSLTQSVTTGWQKSVRSLTLISTSLRYELDLTIFEYFFPHLDELRLLTCQQAEKKKDRQMMSEIELMKSFLDVTKRDIPHLPYLPTLRRFELSVLHCQETIRLIAIAFPNLVSLACLVQNLVLENLHNFHRMPDVRKDTTNNNNNAVDDGDNNDSGPVYIWPNDLSEVELCWEVDFGLKPLPSSIERLRVTLDQRFSHGTRLDAHLPLPRADIGQHYPKLTHLSVYVIACAGFSPDALFFEIPSLRYLSIVAPFMVGLRWDWLDTLDTGMYTSGKRFLHCEKSIEVSKEQGESLSRGKVTTGTSYGSDEHPKRIPNTNITDDDNEKISHLHHLELRGTSITRLPEAWFPDLLTLQIHATDCSARALRVPTTTSIDWQVTKKPVHNISILCR